MSRKRLPLSVIGGFLGAGKTTLLNHWLRQAGGQRLAVLVNDFGALNIDAGLIESTAADTIALTNGCVCCQIGDDLTMALIRVLDSAAAFDAVVIEASGVSDPWRIAQMGRADPGLSLDGVIVLVDAVAAMAQARDPLLADTLERQLKAADLIVVNKIDLLDADTRPALHAWIESVAGAVPRFETTQAAVPLPMLSGLAMPHPEQSAAHAHDACGSNAAHDTGHANRHDHAHGDKHNSAAPDHGAVFETWSCRPDHRFDSTALQAWLREPPAGLLRLKGVLRTTATEGREGADGWSEIQFAGRHGTLRRATEPNGGAALVAIGLTGRLPADRLNRFFGARGASA